jgi:transcriptional regulator with XRE-family HTH domain
MFWLPDKIKSSGLSVQEFAENCRLSRSAIYHFIKDTRRPDEKTIATICRVLGVPLEEGKAQYTPKPLGRPKKSIEGDVLVIHGVAHPLKKLDLNE